MIKIELDMKMPETCMDCMFHKEEGLFDICSITGCLLIDDEDKQRNKNCPLKEEEKSEYEHDHEVVKAYNDGQAYILDKIRAEIEETVKTEANQDKKWASGLRYSLKIIDKYRESEEK